MRYTNLPGYVITDVAVEYYRAIGKEYSEDERDKARKSFFSLKNHDLDAIEKAIDTIHDRNKEYIQQERSKIIKQEEKKLENMKKSLEK